MLGEDKKLETGTLGKNSTFLGMGDRTNRTLANQIRHHQIDMCKSVDIMFGCVHVLSPATVAMYFQRSPKRAKTES